MKFLVWVMIIVMIFDVVDGLLCFVVSYKYELGSENSNRNTVGDGVKIWGLKEFVVIKNCWECKYFS